MQLPSSWLPKASRQKTIWKRIYAAISGDYGDKCNECGIPLNDDVPYTNIPHTDVYYCDACLGRELKEGQEDDLGQS